MNGIVRFKAVGKTGTLSKDNHKVTLSRPSSGADFALTLRGTFVSHECLDASSFIDSAAFLTYFPSVYHCFFLDLRLLSVWYITQTHLDSIPTVSTNDRDQKMYQQ